MSDSSSNGEGSGTSRSERGGLIAWFAKNHVAANLTMLVLIVGGLLTIPRLQKEVFPEVTLDTVTIRVPYPGASPEEVEQGVVRAIEEQVRGLDGVKEVRSVADEGVGLVNAELLLGSNRDQLLSDVESAVGRITSFPEDAEQPTISLATNKRQVIALILSGDSSPVALRDLAEQLKTQLLADDRITLVEIGGARPIELAVEISQEALRRHRLTLPRVAQAIDSLSLDLAAGEIETDSRELAVRVSGREEHAETLANVPLVAGDGEIVRLGDIGEVRRDFRDTDTSFSFNGSPAIRLQVFRVGNETPVEVAAAAREVGEGFEGDKAGAVTVTPWNDSSTIFEDRVRLLLENGLLGLALVLGILGLFLEPRLAFWVTLGIPVSFLGALLLLPATDISINIISLFAFIVTLGIVVDDAIVAGEAIHRARESTDSLAEAAVRGAKEVARPVTFSVVTTCVAFSPMLFVPGVAGEFFRNIPVVVIAVLAISLVESLLVLPAHLSKRMPRLLELALTPFLFLMSLMQSERVSDWLERLTHRHFEPLVRFAVRHRAVTIAASLAALAAVAGIIAGGVIQFTFLPEIEDDEITVTLRMPVGTPEHVTVERAEQIARTASRAAEAVAGPDILRGVYSEIGVLRSQDRAAPPDTGSHVAMVQAALVPAADREVATHDFAAAWRREVGAVAGAEAVRYRYSAGATRGADINLQLSHPDTVKLRRAAGELADELRHYEGVVDVDDGFSAGKTRLDLQLSPEGRARGLTEVSLGQQVRAALFGAEAQRFQQGPNEVRTHVRLPASERDSLALLDDLVVRAPSGGEVPLDVAADITYGSADTAIERTDLRRTVNVTADVDGANANAVVADLTKRFFPTLEERFPRLTQSAAGEQESQQEAVSSLATGFAFALVVMFAILSIAFRSYLQPLIVLTAIPFGAVGAVLGHIALGFDLSLSSLFGLVALSGVVVNDSLLLVVAANGARASGEPTEEAAVAGAARRFRPILMTSLTTFFGLAPMIFETSTQARFLIPMALSLGFGILIGTVFLLLLVPSLYVALGDVTRWVRRILPEQVSER